MVFNTAFNNISVISWRTVSLMEETGVQRENYRHTASHTVCMLKFLFHIFVGGSIGILDKEKQYWKICNYFVALTHAEYMY